MQAPLPDAQAIRANLERIRKELTELSVSCSFPRLAVDSGAHTATEHGRETHCKQADASEGAREREDPEVTSCGKSNMAKPDCVGDGGVLKRPSVRLVAVTKRQPASAVAAAAAAGQEHFGENYVQELTAKAQELQDLKLKWHMIGTLFGARHGARILVNTGGGSDAGTRVLVTSGRGTGTRAIVGVPGLSLVAQRAGSPVFRGSTVTRVAARTSLFWGCGTCLRHSASTVDFPLSTFPWTDTDRDMHRLSACPPL